VQEVIKKKRKMHGLKLLILCLVSTEDHFQLVIKVFMQIFPIANQHSPAMSCFGSKDMWKEEYLQNTKVLLQQISLSKPMEAMH